MKLKKAEGTSFTEIEIKSLDHLIEVIMTEEKQVYNQKKKLKQILEELGLNDTIQVIDLRSKQMFELYNTYKFAPHLIPYAIVQESFMIINSLEPRLI